MFPAAIRASDLTARRNVGINPTSHFARPT
jgi:hypothetical protein